MYGFGARLSKRKGIKMLSEECGVCCLFCFILVYDYV